MAFMDKNPVEPVDNKLLLQGVKDLAKWRGGKLKWLDTKSRSAHS